MSKKSVKLWAYARMAFSGISEVMVISVLYILKVEGAMKAGILGCRAVYIWNVETILQNPNLLLNNNLHDKFLQKYCTTVP